MYSKQDKNKARQRRHERIRNKIHGTADCPRLNVFRSNAHIHAQIIDDTKGNTLVSCSSVELKLDNGSNIEAAKTVGTRLKELRKRELKTSASTAAVTSTMVVLKHLLKLPEKLA